MDGFIMENPIKMDDLGVPLVFENTHMNFCKVFFSFLGGSASRDFRAVTVFTNSWWHGFLFSQIWMKVDQIYTSIGRGSIDCLIEVFTRPQNAGRWYVIQKNILQFSVYTLQGTNISPKNGILKMIFLFPRWDMLIPWRVFMKHFAYTFVA